MLCGRVSRLLFLLPAVVWWLFVGVLCVLIYGNYFLRFLHFFLCLNIQYLFFLNWFNFFLHSSLFFGQTLTDVFLLSSAVFGGWLLCFLCLYLWLWWLMVLAFFSVCFYSFFSFVWRSFCFSAFLVYWQQCSWWCFCRQMLVWWLFIVIFCACIYQDKSLFDIFFGFGLFNYFLFFFVFILFIYIFSLFVFLQVFFWLTQAPVTHSFVRFLSTSSLSFVLK